MSKDNRKNDNKNNELSRRSVLKGVLGVSATVLAAPLAMSLPVKNAEAWPVRRVPDSWDEEVDILIIGSGFAGLSAAAEAAKTGAKTVILEKMPTYGGNSIINGGVYAAWDSSLHLRKKLNYGNDTPEQHKDDTLKGGDFFNIPELAETLAKGSGDALTWMIEDGGARLREALARAGGHTAYRTHTVVEGIGRGFTEPLRKMAEKNGATIRLDHEVTWIWRQDSESPVLGVEAKRGRSVVNIKVNKGLILASGGFSRDLKMRMDHYPLLTENFNSTNHKGATGEIIRYAQAVGADTLQMNFIQLYPFAEPETGILDTPAVYPFNGPGHGILYVTRHGKRFVSELERRDVCSFAQLKLGEKPTFSIFNQEMITKMGGTDKEVQDGVAKGRFVKADSISELAGKLGIPKEPLVETINRHNQFIKDGKDPDFNKPMTNQMILLIQGPFFGLPQWPAIHHTMGGLRINAKAEVIDVFGKPIPKLYAAGEVTGGVHGSNRLGSNAIPDCVVFGRLAGTTAVK
jgi:urocanate reductase